MLIIQPMDLLLIIGWSALATPLLAVLGFRRIFREPPMIRDAAISCFLTFGFYYFFRLDQCHGWGYRYFHGSTQLPCSRRCDRMEGVDNTDRHPHRSGFPQSLGRLARSSSRCLCVAIKQKRSSGHSPALPT